MARGSEFPTREIASYDVRETAEARTFTAEEHTAILASHIAQECASRDEKIAELEAQVTSLTEEKASLQDQVDVAEAAKEAAEAAKAEAETALTDFKTEVEHEKEVAARRDERVAKMREVLPHKPEEFFDSRAQAWAEKSQEDFDGLVSEFAEVASVPGEPVRNSAMEGSSVAPEKAGAETKSFYGFFKKGER